MGYIVMAAKGSFKAFFVKDERLQRGYRWTQGAQGMQQAQRFETEEEAGEVIIKYRTHRGALARIVPDPRSSSPLPKRRTDGYVVAATSNDNQYFLALDGGVYNWKPGRFSDARAFRFSSQESARRVIDSGHPYWGVGGGAAWIARLRQ